MGQLESSKSAMYTLAPLFSALITCARRPWSERAPFHASTREMLHTQSAPPEPWLRIEVFVSASKDVNQPEYSD